MSFSSNCQQLVAHFTRNLIILSMVCVTLPNALYAAPPEPLGINSGLSISSPDEIVGPLAEPVGPPEPLELRMSPQEKLLRAWGLVSDALPSSLREAPRRGDVIEGLELVAERMRHLDLSSAERWSMELVDYAEVALSEEDYAYASALVRWALELSPHSARVGIRAMRVGHLSGHQSFSDQLIDVGRRVVDDRVFQFSVISNATYPLLLACTVTLYILMVLSFSVGLNAPLRWVGLRAPLKLRGIVAPLLVLPLLVLPVLKGPLWALLIGSLVLLIVLPRRRWLVFQVGVLLGLWGALIPLRESFQTALGSSATTEFVRAGSGVFELSDRIAVEALAVNHPVSAEVQYVLGVLLRRDGQLDEAEARLTKAEALWRQQGSAHERLALAQRGLLAYLTEDYPRADKLLAAAESQGLSGSQLTLSKAQVAFGALAIDKSLELSTEAERSSPTLTTVLRAREERFGHRSPLALTEFPLPWHIAFRSVVESAAPQVIPVTNRIESVGQALMPGASPVLMGVAGLFLLVAFLLRAAPARKIRPEILYAAGPPSKPLRLLIRLIPGGTLVWAGSSVLAALVLVVPIALMFPFIGWPGSTEDIFSAAPTARPLMASILGLWLIGTVCLGWHLKEREE